MSEREVAASGEESEVRGRALNFPFGLSATEDSPNVAFNRVYKRFLEIGQPVGSVNLAIFDKDVPARTDLVGSSDLIASEAHYRTHTPRVLGEARRFYHGLLGFAEIPKPEALRHRGGCWFDASGIDLHLSVGDDAPGVQRHFGLDCSDVDALRAKLAAAGCEIDPGRPGPWRRFFTRDPFGNRIEIHDSGASQTE